MWDVERSSEWNKSTNSHIIDDVIEIYKYRSSSTYVLAFLTNLQTVIEVTNSKFKSGRPRWCSCSSSNINSPLLTSSSVLSYIFFTCWPLSNFTANSLLSPSWLHPRNLILLVPVQTSIILTFSSTISCQSLSDLILCLTSTELYDSSFPWNALIVNNSFRSSCINSNIHLLSFSPASSCHSVIDKIVLQSFPYYLFT